MKNFDEKRAQRPARTPEERTFTIGGQQFMMRAEVRPEALIPVERITPDSPISADLAAMDELILNLLEDEYHEAWRALRARNFDPLTNEDIAEVSTYLVERVSGRPTGQPSGSMAAPNGNGPSSTVASSSPALAAV